MARGIYEINLNERYFPALSQKDALEMRNNGNCGECLQDSDVDINCLVPADDTMKLFILAKTMEESNRFEFSEIYSVVSALAIQLGYKEHEKEITNCILKWIERLDEMNIVDLEEWIIG